MSLARDATTAPSWARRWWRLPGESLWEAQHGNVQYKAHLKSCSRTDWVVQVEFNDRRFDLAWDFDSGILDADANVEISRAMLADLVAALRQRSAGIVRPDGEHLRLLTFIIDQMSVGEWVSGRKLRQRLALSESALANLLRRLTPRWLRVSIAEDSQDYYSPTLPALLWSVKYEQFEPVRQAFEKLLTSFHYVYAGNPDTRLVDWPSMHAVDSDATLIWAVASISQLMSGGTFSASSQVQMTVGVPPDIERLASNQTAEEFELYLFRELNKPSANTVTRPVMVAPLALASDGLLPDYNSPFRAFVTTDEYLRMLQAIRHHMEAGNRRPTTQVIAEDANLSEPLLRVGLERARQEGLLSIRGKAIIGDARAISSVLHDTGSSHRSRRKRDAPAHSPSAALRTRLFNLISDSTDGDTSPERSFSLSTRRGNRPDNQDRAVVMRLHHASFPSIAVAVLGDGLGGMAQGAHAATSATVEFLLSIAETAFNHPPDVVLRRAVSRANERVYSELAGAGGTTMSAVLVRSGDIAFCNVGDSRIFAVAEDGVPVQLTRDDTIRAQLEAMGEAPALAVRAHEQLLQFVGIGRSLSPKIERMFNVPERVILATDGAHRIGQSIFRELWQHSSMHDFCLRLTTMSVWTGGFDNATAVVLDPRAVVRAGGGIDAIELFTPSSRVEVLGSVPTQVLTTVVENSPRLHEERLERMGPPPERAVRDVKGTHIEIGTLPLPLADSDRFRSPSSKNNDLDDAAGSISRKYDE